MRTFDLSPLFRATVGFDRLGEIVDWVNRTEDANAPYPPYNIEKTGDDSYRVSIAAAGFGPEDLDVSVHGSVLTVTGRSRNEGDGSKFLHRGIAGRAFQRRFELADHVHVVSATQENGILHVDLVREVPETARPRKIEITTKTDVAPALIEATAKAA
jgi:molecular chaperone IbpA